MDKKIISLSFCLFLILLCSGFKYKDKVYIKAGFFQGCYGTVLDEYNAWQVSRVYQVKVRCQTDQVGVKAIHEGDMEYSAVGADY